MFKHQYRGDGWHRIVKLDIAGFLDVSGEWVSYHNVAAFEFQGRTFFALSDFFAGGVIEINRVLEVKNLLRNEDAGSEMHPANAVAERAHEEKRQTSRTATEEAYERHFNEFHGVRQSER